jgi:type II secretory pathway pseudopilin PulG
MPQPRHPSAVPPQRGSALLLLLVLLVGGAALFVGAVGRGNRDQQRQEITLRRIGEARDALVGYALAHGRLPRPALSALDGNETPQSCDSDADCTGFVPWVTLGIERSDGWHHLLRYSVTPAFTAPSVARSVAASKVVLRRLAGGALVYVAGQEQCSQALLCVPAVVFSTGRDNFGISEQGIIQADNDSSGGNVDERANAVAAQRFITRLPSEDTNGPGGRFDDLVGWIDVAQLLSRMDRARQLH